jgi:polyhydroxyalkanoate synthesis regulator phasin
MAARKKTAARTTARRRTARTKPEPAARTRADVLRDTWSAAVSALGAAEEEMAGQLGGLLRRNRITADDAAAAIHGLRARLDNERRKLGHTFDAAVHNALASLNVPSRQEVAELTSKVDELSGRIESLRTPSRRKPARLRRTSAA